MAHTQLHSVGFLQLCLEGGVNRIRLPNVLFISCFCFAALTRLHVVLLGRVTSRNFHSIDELINSLFADR